MLADDVACNVRNKFPGCVYHSSGRTLDLYGDNIEVDYRGNEVTVENFLRVLTGKFHLAPQELASQVAFTVYRASRCFRPSLETLTVGRSVKRLRLHDGPWR